MTVDYEGRVLSASDYFTTDNQIMVAYVPMHGVHTIYATIGDLFAWLCIIGLLALTVLAIVQSRKRRSAEAAAAPLAGTTTDSLNNTIGKVRLTPTASPSSSPRGTRSVELQRTGEEWAEWLTVAGSLHIERGRRRARSTGMESEHERLEVYQIVIKGHLDSEWSEWFEGLTITMVDNGATILSGPLVDQTALHGVLIKIRDLGLPLLSLTRIDPDISDVFTGHLYSQQKEHQE